MNVSATPQSEQHCMCGEGIYSRATDSAVRAFAKWDVSGIASCFFFKRIQGFSIDQSQTKIIQAWDEEATAGKVLSLLLK
jgi:hypothetical protein